LAAQKAKYVEATQKYDAQMKELEASTLSLQIQQVKMENRTLVLN
jgi:hypothetical protein